MKINIAEIESYWLKRGHFNINLYINYLRAKNERFQDNIQKQDYSDSQSIRQKSCISVSGQMDRFNLKN
jgi:hypothetical protein